MDEGRKRVIGVTAAISVADLRLRLRILQIGFGGQPNALFTCDQVQLPNAKAFLVKLMLVSLTVPRLLSCCPEIGLYRFQLLL
jgi:hypothetical protein